MRHALLVIILCAGVVAATAQESSVTAPLVYVSGYAAQITCYRLDPASGALTPVSTSPAGENPSFLALSPDRRFAYAAQESASGQVGAYAVQRGDGTLSALGLVSSGGKGPCHVSVHPTGRWVFAANYGSGHVVALRVRADGGLDEGTPVLAGRNAHMALPDPSGRFLLVPCLGSDHVAIYRFDAASGSLIPHEPATVATATGAGPRHLAFAPDGGRAYLVDELDDRVSAWSWDARTGVLAPLGSASTLPVGVDGGANHCAHLAVARDGRLLYASNRGHDSIAAFRLGADQPMPIGHETGGGEIRRPRHFALSPDGGIAIVASQDTDLVTVFRVDPASGAWTRLGAQAVSSKPSCVIFAD